MKLQASHIVKEKSHQPALSLPHNETIAATWPLASKHPTVSLVIPCRNEAELIADCLNSILSNDYPMDRVEVLVVDGRSEDRTRHIVLTYVRRFSNVRLLDNPRRIIPAAMNIGIERSSGEFVLKIDAHSIYPTDYITNCVRRLIEFDADMAGGIWTIAARGHSLVAQSIASALSHWFASGNAHVKIGAKQPRWADAAAFGCWRRETLERIGRFNENLAGSSDMDLNNRLRHAGGRILLAPEIKVTYFADSTLRRFCAHNFSDGVWTTLVLKFGSHAYSWRHWVPLTFVLTLVVVGAMVPFHAAAGWLLSGVCAVYLGLNLLSSLQVAVQNKSLRQFVLLPLIFSTRHISHGLGAFYGIVLASVPGLTWKGRRSANAR